MEGRGFSGLYKNSSEDLFLKTMMESPIGMPVPTMEMLGFKTVSQSFRTDSEELFKRWLTNEEGYNSSSIGLNSRLSKRISTEIVNVSSQQHVGVASEGRNNDKSCIQNNFLANDVSSDFNFPIREPVDRELQSSNLFLAKAWFLTDQRMTRSRSSELRRRYTEMQNVQATQGIESMCMAPLHGTNTMKQEVANFNGFDYLTMCEFPSQKGSFMMSPSPSSSSTFNTHQLVDADKVSSCVSMLKGTLQRKRLGIQVEKEASGDGLNEIFCIQEPLFQSGFNEEQQNWSHQKIVNVQGDFTDQVRDLELMETHEGTTNFVLDGFANQANQIHGGTASGEPSQSESSAAAPVISSGLDACEGPSNSNQTLCDSSWKQVGESTQNKVKGFREQIMDNLKDDKKKRSLERYGSITSAVSDDKVDTTKKRRVERSRKMAEAKERNLTPIVPSDMQAVLKRCENLEKEVRSLKLNLSFMNRKDSEQTKQIEDLQKQNEDLADEKERLLEEIERILSESGKI
ncbi:protein CYCLOPS isoform X2 [Cicer arietinum]|uniref:Protein CYCLOPS isoform X2 n=1 Tax=Cicer arietinum TaxID=3827 RepID=A0A1S2YZJ4_CICAR|nr:protein CYCLOPS isoform X2 [Cicer arietinum]